MRGREGAREGASERASDTVPRATGRVPGGNLGRGGAERWEARRDGLTDEGMDRGAQQRQGRTAGCQHKLRQRPIRQHWERAWHCRALTCSRMPWVVSLIKTMRTSEVVKHHIQVGPSALVFSRRHDKNSM